MGQFIITLEQFQQILPDLEESEEWYDKLIEITETYDINTEYRIAAFLAQTIHESAKFEKLSENMNYSSERLKVIFPRYFVKVDANKFHRNPEKIANWVYANRMGNGDYNSGDGWLFRGGGLLHLSGRENYEAFAEATEMEIEECSEYCRTKEGAIESACWFWETNGLNKYADLKDIITISKKVNGGKIGLPQRIDLYKEIIGVLFNEE